MAMRSPIELPLLRRELIELAQRKRTYLLRSSAAVVLLAVVLYGLKFQAVGPAMQYGTGSIGGTGALGSGGHLFARLIPFLFLAIPALTPALCATAIATEKEQNTFGTLLLTRLTPWTIIIEKLLSRIIPMLTLLLVVSPVLAYLYSLGGVDPGQLFGSVLLLFCDSLLFASLCLFLSAWFPSTLTTFVWSYIGAGLLLIVGTTTQLTGFGIWIQHGGLWAVMGAGGVGGGPATTAALSFSESFGMLATPAIYPLCIALLLLLGARLVLVRRAFAGHASLVISLFRSLDRFFKWLNQRTTGGIELVQESSTLPEAHPITWRERNKKSLGQFRWLVRVLLVLEGPTLFVCASAAIANPLGRNPVTSVLLGLLWIAAVVLAAVKGASLFSQERSRQTLEPLLSCTLSSRDLMQQKVTGTNRLLMVVACPVLTVCVTQAYMSWGMDLIWTGGYLLLSTLLTFVILRTVVWITAAVGTWIKSPNRAITMSLVLVALLTVLPVFPGVLIVWAMSGSWVSTDGMEYRLSSLGWLGAIASVERTFAASYSDVAFPYSVASGGFTVNVRGVPPWQIVGPAVLLQVGYLLLSRWLVLKSTPRLLQRFDSPSTDEPAPAVQ